MASLDGTWRVEREAGLLPPRILSKQIEGHRGVTRIFGLRLLPFRVERPELRYRGLPLRDEIHPRDDGTWWGVGRFLGIPFCRFRLVPIPR